MIPETDKPVLLALAVRYQLAWEQRIADRQLVEEAQARIKAADEQISGLGSAVRSLGLSTKAGWFAPIEAAVGTDVFVRAMINAGAREYSLGDISNARISAGQNEPATEPDFIEPLVPTAPIKDLVLDWLKRHPMGSKAAEIRLHIEQLRNAELHEKTVGMTLYRLSLDGLARREGRTWFFVPETKNPGAVTPGLFGRDTKEGEEL